MSLRRARPSHRRGTASRSGSRPPFRRASSACRRSRPERGLRRVRARRVYKDLMRRVLVAAAVTAILAEPALGRELVLPLAGKTVAVDPGHNGANWSHPREINRLVDAGGFRKACDTTGTSTDDGYSEAAYTFDVARRLVRILRREGARVVLTRTSNAWCRPLHRRACRDREPRACRCRDLDPCRRRPARRSRLRGDLQAGRAGLAPARARRPAGVRASSPASPTRATSVATVSTSAPTSAGSTSRPSRRC